MKTKGKPINFINLSPNKLGVPLALPGDPPKFAVSNVNDVGIHAITLRVRVECALFGGKRLN